MRGPIPVDPVAHEPVAIFRLDGLLFRLYAKADKGHLHDVTVDRTCFEDRIRHSSRRVVGRGGAPAVRFDLPDGVERLAVPESQAGELLDVLRYNKVHGRWRVAGSLDVWEEF